eukprot:1541251-Amphidinium_carterae.1
MSTKSYRKQKSPLTLNQLAALENLMMAKACTAEACVLGQILFCLHSCARWSDVMALTSEYRLDD